MKKMVGIFLVLITFTIAGCEVKETPGKGSEDPVPQKETYTVTFVLLEETVHEVTVEKGETASSFNPTMTDGQTFEDWYTDEELSETYNFNTLIFEDTTIYGAIIIEDVVENFEVIKQYLFDNGEYRYINEPGREIENYKIQVDIDGLTLYAVYENLILQPENKESITISIVLPEKDGFVGLYVGMSGTKQEYLEGIMHVYDGGIDETQSWQGIDCENYNINDVDSRTCTTFSSNATINNYFYDLKSDNLELLIQTANDYFIETLGVSLQ